jgi:hypothetical protein
MLATGDSGGPSFIGTQLAGIHSFIFSPGAPYDLSQATNSSFGEIAGDTRLANYAEWIDSVVGPVPEPHTWALVRAGLLALLVFARRPHTATGVWPTARRRALPTDALAWHFLKTTGASGQCRGASRPGAVRNAD